MTKEATTGLHSSLITIGCFLIFLFFFFSICILSFSSGQRGGQATGALPQASVAELEPQIYPKLDSPQALSLQQACRNSTGLF